MEQDRNSPGNNALGLGLELLMESDYREGPCNQLGKKKNACASFPYLSQIIYLLIARKYKCLANLEKRSL